MSTFTFKRHPKATGLAHVTRPCQDVDIKFKKHKCGQIIAPNYTRGNLWRVQFSIVDPEPENCAWKWVHLKKTTETEQEMRDWLKANTQAILDRYDLYFMED